MYGKVSRSVSTYPEPCILSGSQSITVHRKSLVGVRGFSSSALLCSVRESSWPRLFKPPYSLSAHLGRIMPAVTDRVDTCLTLLSVLCRSPKLPSPGSAAFASWKNLGEGFVLESC